MTDRTAKLAEIERMIATARNLLAVGLGPENNAEAEARLAVLEAIAEDYRRPEAESGPLLASVMATLERQQVEEEKIGDPDFPHDQVTEYRILGVGTTARAIIDAVASSQWSLACDALSETCLSKRDELPSNVARYSGRRMGLEDAARLARSLRRPDTALARERPSLKEMTVAVCEWDQPKGSCRCAGLAINDENHCQAPIGVARAALALIEGK